MSSSGRSGSAGRPRHGVAAVVTVVALLVVGGLLVAVLLPSMCRPGKTGLRAKCGWNLRQIGLAVERYADDHGGRYPASLAELEAAGAGLSADVFVCPVGHDERSAATDPAGIAADLAASADGRKHCLSYTYVGGALTTATVKPTSVVAYESVADDDDERTVLFGDGHAESLTRGGWQKAASDAGLAVARTITTGP